jgi:hypothetical protein
VCVCVFVCVCVCAHARACVCTVFASFLPSHHRERSCFWLRVLWFGRHTPTAHVACVFLRVLTATCYVIDAIPLLPHVRHVSLIPFRLRCSSLQVAEDTARTVASAASTIDAEAMLARAKAEAEAWTKGTAAARRLASEMPPMQVQAVVAERNALRAQVRSARDFLQPMRPPHLSALPHPCKWAKPIHRALFGPASLDRGSQQMLPATGEELTSSRSFTSQTKQPSSSASSSSPVFCPTLCGRITGELTAASD